MSTELGLNEQQGVNEACLEVFAGISAIVTHEIRNALAIINESAGFLDDLAQMAGEGGSVPGERVKGMAVNVSTQVARANRLMKELNTFAHSGDVPFGTIDLKDTLAMMVALTRRKAAARKVEVTVEGPGGLLLTTRPLVLEALVYVCLITIYEGVPHGSQVTAGVDEEDGAMLLRCTLESAGELPSESFLSEKVDLLAQAIQATCSCGKNQLQIRLESCTASSC